MFRTQASCSGTLARGRAAVLWGLALFLAAQAALDVALDASHPLRDPEYGRRLESLRARQAERPPGRPLIVFLGSSRVAMDVRPAVLPAMQPNAGGGAVVFNCGMCGAGPVLELLTLRRLVADGVHPDLAFIEVWPAAAASSGDEQLKSWFPRERLSWGDLQTLRPFQSGAASERRRWCADHLAPWLSLRTRLLNQWAPSWVPPTANFGIEFECLDGWGWLGLPAVVDECRSQAHTKEVAENQTSLGDHFSPSADSTRAFADLLTLCRREKITAVLLATPDYCLRSYSPDGRLRIDAFFCSLSAENNAPLIDARDWAPAEDFFDAVHLTQRGAAAFTERFGRDVLEPYLAGEPPSLRWPTGRLSTEPAAP